MDDLIILLVGWLVKSLSGKGNATPSPIVRPGPQVPVRPGAPVNRQMPPNLPGRLNRPMPPGLPTAANRAVPPNVRRVAVPANRRPVQRRVAASPPLPGRAVAPAAEASLLQRVSAAKPAAAKARAPVSEPLKGGSWISASVRPEALRRQIIINEILQPPLALRGDI